MPPWSKLSWPQCMLALREPLLPFSVCGVWPAMNSTGTLSREAFISPHRALAVPTVTCTMTAAGLPVMR